MTKKTFKDSTAHLDRFFSGTSMPQETQRTYEPEEACGTRGTYEPHMTHTTLTSSAGKLRYYRLNLKLKAEYREYLEQVSWESRKSITQYLNDLIKADMDTRDTRDT